jgi:hypothetical protein
MRASLESCPARFEFNVPQNKGSWINMIESFFGKLSRVCLKGMRVKSKEELVDRIYGNIKRINEEPVIYRWTQQMDEKTVRSNI